MALIRRKHRRARRDARQRRSDGHRRGRGRPTSWRHSQPSDAGQSATRIAAFIAATARSVDLEAGVHELNGQPALVFYSENEPFAPLLLAIANGRNPPCLLPRGPGTPPVLGPRTAR